METDSSSHSQRQNEPRGLLYILFGFFGFLVGQSFSKLHTAINQSSNAMHRDDSTIYRAEDSARRDGVTETKSPPPPCSYPEKKVKRWWQGWKPWVFVLNIATFVAVAYYACITKRMWTEMQTQTGLLSKQLRFDHRAWIYFEVGQAPLIDGQPIRMPIRVLNSGKTPATHIHGKIFVNLLKRGESPDFVYKSGHPAYEIDPGFMPPNVPQTIVWNVLPKYVPATDALAPVLVNRGVREGINNGNLYIVVHGNITYEDAFGVHWLNFCSASINAPPTGTEAEACMSYNDVDKEK